MNGTEWLLILGISLANNLDNTGVGVAYGAGKIRLSMSVNLWISVITFVMTGSAAFFGDRAASLLSPHIAKLLSAVILCAIGVYVMRPAFAHLPASRAPSSPPLRLADSAPPLKGRIGRRSEGGESPADSVEVPASAVSLTGILGDPARADMDGSRHIDYKEGTLLGVALSINNMGGGISAGLVHLSVFWTAFCSAVLSFLVLWLGGLAGRRLAAGRAAYSAPLVAGAMLIFIGLLQFR